MASHAWFMMFTYFFIQTLCINGLKLRKETATHPQGLRIQASRSYRKDECIKDVWDGEGDDALKFPELGKICVIFPPKRWMLNRNNELVCGQCCSKNHWSNDMNTCAPCSTQNEPNVWTHCQHDYKAPDTSTTISTSTTSTTTQLQKNEDIEKSKGNCVKIGNIPQGHDRGNLRARCVCSSGTRPWKFCRMMFNEKQELVCSLCCANHYFSTQSRKCEYCGDCATNRNPNVFISCMIRPNCKRPSPPNELSTINKKPHTSTIIPTSTTSTTTPTSTVPPVRPPLQVLPVQGNCVKIGNIPQGQLDNLGRPCSCSSLNCRQMFNEEQELVCSVCCANHYFSLKSRKCEYCGDCGVNPNPNVFTRCIPIFCRKKK